MSRSGKKRYARKHGLGRDSVYINDCYGGVRLTAIDERPEGRGRRGMAYLWFPPAQARRIGQAMIHAADIAEEAT